MVGGGIRRSCVMPSISLMTLNARGLESDNEDEESGTLWKMLNTLIKWHKSHGLAVLCVQEHNLHSQKRYQTI